MKKSLLLYFLFALTSFAQIPIPDSGCYNSAFTGDDSHSTFESLAGKNIAIEMFFTGWPSNKVPDFPVDKCNEIDANGAVPHITWMPQVPGSPFPLDAILNGSYDNYITVYAVRVKTWGKPLFIRLGHEFNGDWYTYGGANNGGGTLDGFGDPTKADGPERFIAAYKRVHDIFESISVDNVAWVWCMNNGSAPNATWNVPEAYYPGDEYVDWIGFDGYNFGTTQTWSGWNSFSTIYNSMYQKFKTYNKPIMIGEFASVEQGGNKATWITDAYSTWLKLVYTKIKAVTWFHIAKVEGTVFTDWRINSSSASLTAYQNVIADPYFLSTIPATDVDDKNVIPKYFALEQNYPNPFNPTTKIKFLLPNSGSAKLVVYNIFGEKITTLVQSYLSAGIHEVDFSGENLSSGVYLYALEFDGKREMRKMILQK